MLICPPHPKSGIFSIWISILAESTASLVLTSSAFLQCNAPRYEFRKKWTVVLRVPGFHGFGIFNFKDRTWIEKRYPEIGENKSDQFNILSSCYMMLYQHPPNQENNTTCRGPDSHFAFPLLICMFWWFDLCANRVPLSPPLADFVEHDDFNQCVEMVGPFSCKPKIMLVVLSFSLDHTRSG
jgi:hypothetical protein